jgi:hypothetical protein
MKRPFGQASAQSGTAIQAVALFVIAQQGMTRTVSSSRAEKVGLGGNRRYFRTNFAGSASPYPAVFEAARFGDVA